MSVGDQVIFSLDQHQTSENNLDDKKITAAGLITSIEPRRNYIIRQSPYRNHYAQLIAVNIDQAMLVLQATILKSTPTFIDRFLIAAESFSITPVLVFNKIDLLKKDEIQQLKDLRSIYESIGYQTISLSALKEQHLEDFSQLLSGKVSLLIGYSGVGKSTLINTISPEIQQKVGSTQVASQKGRHTTTYARMFEIDPKTYLIDTPGIQELTPYEIDAQLLKDCFPELRACKEQCKFHNCMHKKEPGCAVLEALEKGTMAPSRYQSYCTLLDEILMAN